MRRINKINSKMTGLVKNLEYLRVNFICVVYLLSFVLLNHINLVNSQLLANLACGITKFTANSGTIISPGFNSGAYPSDTSCEYHVEIKAGEVATFKFVELDLEDAGGGECYDSVTIISPSGESSGPICGTERDDYVVRADIDGEVLLELITDESENRKGFKIEYTKDIADPCDPNPCLHGGTCSSVLGQARCFCSDGWTGDICDEDINECLDTVNPVCNEAEQVCVNTPGSYLCEAKSYSTLDFNVDSLFIDQNTGNPCVLSESGRDLLNVWMEEYRQWRLLLQDYAIKYDQWKNEECPENV